MEKNLGHATAYGYAKSKGYSGTEDEFAELMADYASVGQSAAQSAEQAAASATSASASAQTASQAAQTATSKASEAVTAAGTATTKASEASQSASTASAAATSASTSAQTATTAATTSTTKASEASESAATATTAKTDAESARDAAAQSASEAAESAASLVVDDTLSVDGRAANSKSVGKAIGTVTHNLELIPASANLFDTTQITSGILTEENTHKTNASYFYTDYISVTPGDTISYYSKDLNYPKAPAMARTSRYVTAFDSNKKNLPSEGSNTASFLYTVGENTHYIRITIETRFNFELMILANAEEAPTEYVPYEEAQYIATEAFIEKALGGKKQYIITAEKASLTNGQTLTACSDIDNKKNDVITFYAEVDASSFGSVSVGHGYNMSYGAYCVIDATNITTFYGTSQYTQKAHGLNIDKFIHVEITHDNNARAGIKLYSVDGSYEIPSAAAAWGGCKGDVFATSTNSTLTNCVLTTAFKDWLEDIYLCGDSYVGLGDTARWPYYLLQNGYTKIAINGFGGAHSSDQIKVFRNIIELSRPKYFVWCLGMNDPDASDAINTSYKDCLDEFVTTCETYGVTPILATIPNTPNRLHTFKNTYVKSLGYRYVDFAKAVGAEEAGSAWYSGLLANDNTHPTALGAKALYSRLITDIPEIVK